MSGLGGGVVRWSLVLAERPIGCEEKSSLNFNIYIYIVLVTFPILFQAYLL